MINGKSDRLTLTVTKSIPGLNILFKRMPLFVMPVAYFHPLAETELRKLLPKLASVIGSMQWEAMECSYATIVAIINQQWNHGVNM